MDTAVKVAYSISPCCELLGALSPFLRADRFHTVRTIDIISVVVAFALVVILARRTRD